MKLTPYQAEAVYDCLRSFPPFKGWKLPPGEEVEFLILHKPKIEAAYEKYIGEDRHAITISSASVGSLYALIEAMAHELIHFHQELSKTFTPHAMHNAEFRAIAKRVCRQFLWDHTKFVV